MTHELKQGWEWKKLGEVCNTSSGGTPLKSNKSYYQHGNIAWLLSGEVAQGNIYHSENFITSVGLKNSSAKIFPPETVLVAMYGATAGQVGILRISAATNQAICGILPNDKMVSEFIFYYFLKIKNMLVAQAIGNAQPNISQEKIKNIEIPLPPLSEQHTIVEKLDKAFEALNRLEVIYKQNKANAKALFESELTRIFTQKGEGWEEKKLGEVCETQYGLNGTLNTGNTGYKIFRMGEIVENRMIDNNNMKYINISEETFKDYTLEKGDILFNRTNSYDLVGKSGLFDLDGKYCFASYLVKIKFKKEMYPNFAIFYLNSKSFLLMLRNLAAKSINQANINATILRNQSISYPPLSEQVRIAKHFDTLSTKTKRLEALYEDKLKALKLLKEALLTKAFKGELS